MQRKEGVGPMTAISAGASVEAFWRSALNTLMLWRVAGVSQPVSIASIFSGKNMLRRPPHGPIGHLVLCKHSGGSHITVGCAHNTPEEQDDDAGVSVGIKPEWAAFPVLESTPLTPPMQPLQVCVRVGYMNGIKATRAKLKAWTETGPSAGWHALLLAVGPGLVMTPAASLLEAAVVDSQQALYRRWVHGFTPRSFREVLFGVGLNELSDACQSNLPEFVTNPVVRTSVGSLAAGVLSGLASQVPHNLSLLKLSSPDTPYRAHLQTLMAQSRAMVPARLYGLLPPLAWVFFAPSGGMWRSVSIAGTFLIVNGVVHVLCGHTKSGHGGGFGTTGDDDGDWGLNRDEHHGGWVPPEDLHHGM